MYTDRFYVIAVYINYSQLFNPISAGGGEGVESTPSSFFLCHPHKDLLIDSKLSEFQSLLLRHNPTRNQVHNLSGGHVITLLMDALCFNIYLSLCLPRIFKFYFPFFLTLMFSVSVFFLEKLAFGYLFIKASKFDKSFVDVNISVKIQNFDDF